MQVAYNVERLQIASIRIKRLKFKSLFTGIIVGFNTQNQLI